MKINKVLFPVLLLLILNACTSKNSIEEINNVGYAQGTTFNIKYLSHPSSNLKSSIDSLFLLVDLSMSTYNDSSLISKINVSDSFERVDEHFYNVLSKALLLSEESDGLFDVSIGALSNLWGFGLSKRSEVDSSMVDSAKNNIGYKKIQIKNSEVDIPPGMKLDFNSIAQGYTVDLIANFLEAKNVENYMVEVGGELRAKGKNSKNNIWRIGIDKPEENLDPENRLQAIIELENSSLATSGNYRKFWLDPVTGQKFSHTINPKSGYPAKNELLSVSIIAPTAMEADGYSTMCMVLGLQKSIKLIESKNNLEAYLIFINEDDELEVYTSEGFRNYLIN